MSAHPTDNCEKYNDAAVWLLCGRLWTRARVDFEEEIIDRIEFNRQQIVLWSFLPRPFVATLLPRQTTHSYCSVVFITFRHTSNHPLEFLLFSAPDFVPFV